MPVTDDAVPLAEMIETLRQELQVALRHGAGEEIAFDIEKVEMELKVAISRKTKGEGAVKFWVITAGGGAERGSDSTHTFKLTVTPTSRRTGKRISVSGGVEGPVSDH